MTTDYISIFAALLALLASLAYIVHSARQLKASLQRKREATPEFFKTVLAKQEADTAQLKYAAQFGADLRPIRERMARETAEMMREFHRKEY